MWRLWIAYKKMINTPKPVTSVGNTSKPPAGETWSAITSSWLSETRSWLAVSKLIANITAPVEGYLLLLENGGIMLTEDGGRMLLTDGGTITNFNKP